MAVKLRLIGNPDEIETVLNRLHDSPGMTVVDTSGPRPNRHDRGVRVYAVVTVDGTLRAEETRPRPPVGDGAVPLPPG